VAAERCLTREFFRKEKVERRSYSLSLTAINQSHPQSRQSGVALIVASYSLDFIFIDFIGHLIPLDSVASLVLIATLTSVICAFKEWWIYLIYHKHGLQGGDIYRAKIILKIIIFFMAAISFFELAIRLYEFPLLLIVGICLVFLGYKKVLTQELDKFLPSSSFKNSSSDYTNFMAILGLVAARLVAWGSIEVSGVQKIIWYLASLTLFIAQFGHKCNESHIIESNRKITYRY